MEKKFLLNRVDNVTFCFFRLEREKAKAEKENQAHQKEVKFFVLMFLVGANFSSDLLRKLTISFFAGTITMSLFTLQSSAECC